MTTFPPYKPRTEPLEMTKLKLLNKRMELSPDARYYLSNLIKGYDGEVQFDKLTAHFNSKYLILQDLRLKVNNTEFQMDTVIITQETLIICDVKNHEGDYYFLDGNFYKKANKKKTSNPLHQLNRCITLLRDFLNKHGLDFHIEGFLIFINPDFFLYNAPQNQQIIHYTQINRFLSELDTKPAKLNSIHRKLADVFLLEHITESQNSQVPPYTYEGIKKGMTCAICDSYSISISNKKIVCNICEHEEDLNSAVVRCVEEIRVLFPEKEITTNLIMDWCNKIKCPRTIRKIMKRNFILKGHGIKSWYVNR